MELKDRHPEQGNDYVYFVLAFSNYEKMTKKLWFFWTFDYPMPQRWYKTTICHPQWTKIHLYVDMKVREKWCYLPEKTLPWLPYMFVIS